MFVCLDERTVGIEVGRHHHGQTLEGRFFQSLVEVRQVVAQSVLHGESGGIVGRSEERQGVAHHFGRVRSAGSEGQDHALEIRFALSVFPHRAAHEDVVQAEQFLARFEAGARIVVAGNENDAHAGVFDREMGEEVVEKSLHLGGGVGAVEDVAAHNEGIGLLLHDGVAQPAEEVAVFGHTIVAMEDVAEVPIGGVYDFHRVS